MNRYEDAASQAIANGRGLGEMLRELPAGTSKDELQKYSDAYVKLTLRELPQTAAPPVTTVRQESRSRGSVYKDRKTPSWFVRFYTGEVKLRENGSKNYVMKTLRVGSTSASAKDFIRTKFDAVKKAEELIAADRAESAKQIERSEKHDYTVEQYYTQVVLPIWQHNLEVGELKPSTVHGYKKNFEYFVKPKIGGRKMAEFDTVAASKFLEDVASQGLGANTFAHVRFVAQRVFGMAAAKGAISVNPFDSAESFKKPKAAKATRKYTAREVALILAALNEHLQAQVAVGLCYFGGLRPGEARAVRWENYFGDGLRIEQSQWRTKLTAPKTGESAVAIPVRFPLGDFLNKLREASGNPKSGFILAGEKNGKPLNFEWLAREVIRPALKKAGLEWEGFYACRRGCSTDIMSETKDAQGAAGMLRHKNTRVTVNNYIGIAPEHRNRAAEALSANFARVQKSLTSGAEK